MALFRFSTFLALCVCAASAQEQDDQAFEAEYSRVRDSQVSSLAAAAVNERCEDGFIGDFDERADREALEDALGGENFVLDILLQSDNQQEAKDNIATYFQGEGGGELIRRRAVGLVMFILMIALSPFFCATACSCCMRCRICRPNDGPRNTSIIFKVLGMVFIGGIGLGICICWGYAWAAHAKTSDGLDNMGCTSAKLVHSTLLGQENPKFIGMNNMVSEFTELADALDSDSQFVQQLNALIDDTEDIDVSIYLATETLRLLSDMMAIAPNARPGPGGFHRCDFCREIKTQLDPAILALENSLGTALAEARGAAKEQLSEANREDIKKLLTDSIQPVTDLKDQIRDILEPLVETENWDTIQMLFNRVGLAVVMLLVIVAAMLAAVAAVAMLMFIFREKHSDEGYNRSVHRSACCTWMCAWILCVFCFLWGGFLEVYAVPMSSVCLILDDVSGNMIRDIRTALELELDPTSDDFIMLTDSVDRCLNPADPDLPANFVDILFTRDENNTKVTMRQQLQEQVEEQITSRFDLVAQKINDINHDVQTDLSNEPGVMILRQHVSTAGANVDGLILANVTAIIEGSGEPWVSALPESWLGYSATVSCDVYEATNGVVSYIEAEDAAIGVALNFPDPPCPGVSGDGTRVVGSTCASTTDANRCAAADWLLQEKYRLMTGNGFRCDVFEDDSGRVCDIIDMRQTDPRTNAWSGDCRRSDGTLKRRHVWCSLDQFKSYVAGFDQRIGITMERVDSTTPLLAESISVQMRNDLDEFIIMPINDIIEGVQCNWLSEYYQETVWGLCYQGVVGLNTIGAVYVGLGFLLVLLIIIMYALWRRAVDNVQLREIKLNSHVESGNNEVPTGV